MVHDQVIDLLMQVTDLEFRLQVDLEIVEGSQPGGSTVVPENAAMITAGNSDVRYPHLVEYGHGNGFHGSAVPPKPFFWPAFRMHRKKMMSLSRKP